MLNISLRVWLPNEGAIRVRWLLPAIEGVLLLVLVLGNPARLASQRRWLRPLAAFLVAVLVVAALWATTLLIYDLIKGIGVIEKPEELLASGAVVWIGNNLSFALLYWLIDSGGPFMRSRLATPVDFAFTQHMSPELAPPGWRSVFLDYRTSGSRTRRRSARPT